jgi:hypothetical protein
MLGSMNLPLLDVSCGSVGFLIGRRACGHRARAVGWRSEEPAQ